MKTTLHPIILATADAMAWAALACVFLQNPPFFPLFTSKKLQCAGCLSCLSYNTPTGDNPGTEKLWEP